MNRHCCLMLLSLPLLAACGKPQPPETERRPEPQATAMRDAMAKPLEEAKTAQATAEQSARAQHAALEAATGDARPQ
ncbi:hypothetical protein [Stenotrophomonas sp. SY1]|uniref:hypothetical protein n=1 Tax=Stenotrophomonas sp. SY1 TaxID=477235 RepID=UPI001E3BC51B|nr:hypothetical protein [Stenotrophomonas sp. SY1]MCD9085654.1 hypothetical protein [Stenotrophomonas sp. SY1]